MNIYIIQWEFKLMTIGSILEDAVRYPFSDWKKILILGILTLVMGIYPLINEMGLGNEPLFLAYLFFSFIIGIFVSGYVFRIIKTSLNDVHVLPNFNLWIEMFKDGLRVFVVTVVYLIPAVAILMYHGSSSLAIFGVLNSTPNGIFMIFVKDLIHAYFSGRIGIFISIENIWYWIFSLYCFITIFIYAIAISNMAKNKSKLMGAFNVDEIFKKITEIGLKKIILFYIITIIPYTTVYLLMDYISGYILICLIALPYLYMFSSRLIALLYKNNNILKED